MKAAADGKAPGRGASENPERRKIEQIERARRIVLAHGWNSVAYQIINPGISRWFSADGSAVVGFVAGAGFRVVAGAPVCAETHLPRIAAEFEADAANVGESVCYFCAQTRLEAIYSDSPRYSKMLLGAQPVWDPRRWESMISQNKSLRAQLNRARNKGVSIAEWSIEKAHDHPALRRCLREWLDTKGLPPMRFLVQPDTLARLFDRRVFVAERAGKILGFVLLSPIPKRKGWLFEQFVHRPGAANGTVELMIDHAMRALAADGCEYATLGLSPLSKRAPVEPFRNPFWLRLVLAWMQRHGQRFYNFDGLDRFKAKLRPDEWEPVFAVANEPRISPKTLYAIAAAFSENAPIKLVTGGLWRAAKTEIKWLKRKIGKNL